MRIISCVSVRIFRIRQCCVKIVGSHIPPPPPPEGARRGVQENSKRDSNPFFQGAMWLGTEQLDVLIYPLGDPEIGTISTFLRFQNWRHVGT
jgi:hypothetical protein